MNKQSKLAALLAEIDALKREVSELKARPVGEKHIHYHYDFTPAIYPTTTPQTPTPFPWTNICGVQKTDGRVLSACMN